MAQQLRPAATAAGLIRRLRRPGRYARVGLGCALLNNAGMIALDRAGEPYLPSLLAAGLVSTLAGYAAHSLYTFRVPISWRALGCFMGASAGSFAASAAMMVAMCSGAGLSASVALPIATVLLFAWNFVAARWAIAGRPADAAA